MTDQTATGTGRKQPRDWRYWVGGTGRVLLVIGVLMFGFLAYQLWGTGIEYRQSQSSLKTEFEQRQAALATESLIDQATNDSQPTDTTVALTSTTTGNSVPATGSGDLPDTTVRPGSTSTTVNSGTTATTTKPRRKRWPLLEKGEALAVIEIPRLHKQVYAVAGVGPKDLKRGIGHYPGTPLPGQFGNAAFAGHRTTYGAPLFNIDKLRAGDTIVVYTLLRERFVYVVAASPRVISSKDSSVVLTTDPSVASLTLTSCHPKYSAKQRIAVFAVLDPNRSGIVQDPTPEVDPPKPSDNPEPTNPDNPVEPGASEPVATDALTSDGRPHTTDAIVPGTNDSGTSSSGSDAIGDTPTVDVGTGESVLAHGWFDDSAAWWHVIGWSLLDLVVVAGGWALARRTNRRWLGIVVAAVPFLFVLYFVYQNVNRLLPADL